MYISKQKTITITVDPEERSRCAWVMWDNDGNSCEWLQRLAPHKFFCGYFRDSVPGAWRCLECIIEFGDGGE